MPVQQVSKTVRCLSDQIDSFFRNETSTGSGMVCLWFLSAIIIPMNKQVRCEKKIKCSHVRRPLTSNEDLNRAWLHCQRHQMLFRQQDLQTGVSFSRLWIRMQISSRRMQIRMPISSHRLRTRMAISSRCHSNKRRTLVALHRNRRCSQVNYEKWVSTCIVMTIFKTPQQGNIHILV